jgi:hypothetical protein
MAHARGMLDNWGYRQSLRICNYVCFSTATMVTREWLSVICTINFFLQHYGPFSFALAPLIIDAHSTPYNAFVLHRMYNEQCGKNSHVLPGIRTNSLTPRGHQQSRHWQHYGCRADIIKLCKTLQLGEPDNNNYMVLGRGPSLDTLWKCSCVSIWCSYDTQAPSKTAAQATNSCATLPSTFLRGLSCSLRTAHSVREQQTSNRRHFY